VKGVVRHFLTYILGYIIVFKYHFNLIFMALENNWDRQLKHLPQFEENPFGGVPVDIFEMALITTRLVPDTEPLYRGQFIAGVVGRGMVDNKPVLYFSTNFMKWNNGRVLDSGRDGSQVRLSDLENCSDAYQVLLPNDQMKRPMDTVSGSL
jgi:hypothetical protein